MAYELPDLPYAYDALEPHINAVTMRLHHDRHHNTYVANLNAAFEKYPAADRGSMDEILTDLEAVPEDIRASVQNNTQTRTKEAQDEGAKRDGTPPGVARGPS